ncbi:alcohol dehydrogenase catalytic domain-containing protein [Candidatus Poribacteria bacterium]|nr:alcohol dehydrogenase catalytic domain-containing protein [Candidatus Poribacteria bacterium]
MKAAFLHKPGDIRIDETDIPVIEDDEALIKIRAVGVCGSDVHFYNKGRIGDFIVKRPLILGHECAGEVVEIGKNVKNLKPGDRVAIEAGVPCRKCYYCRTGRYNLCADVTFLATPPFHGAFCEYIVHPEDYLFKLPDNMTFEEGAMIEPLAVGVYAAERGDVNVKNTVAIIGSGPIGLMILQSVRARGVTDVVITDLQVFRLELAKKLGASLTINVTEDDPVEKILDFTNGGADVVMDAVGLPETLQQTINIARMGATIVWVGMPTVDEIPIRAVEAICKDVDIRGIFRYANAYPTAIKMVSNDQVDVKSMITTTFTLDHVQEALEYPGKHPETCIKVIVEI